MPTQGFEVIVGVPNAINDERVAIATASKYLARADTSKTFPETGDVFDVDVYGDSQDGFAIGLQFVATIENDAALKRFMDEMATLAKVESVERNSYVVA